MDHQKMSNHHRCLNRMVPGFTELFPAAPGFRRCTRHRGCGRLSQFGRDQLSLGGRRFRNLRRRFKFPDLASLFRCGEPCQCRDKAGSKACCNGCAPPQTPLRVMLRERLLQPNAKLRRGLRRCRRQLPQRFRQGVSSHRHRTHPILCSRDFSIVRARCKREATVPSAQPSTAAASG